MSASKQAKEAGLKSLSQVTELTDISQQTLDLWSKNRKKLFDVVLTGCKQKITEGEGDDSNRKIKN